MGVIGALNLGTQGVQGRCAGQHASPRPHDARVSHPSEAGTRNETSSLGAQLNTDVGICSPPPLLLLAANAQAAWPPSIN